MKVIVCLILGLIYFSTCFAGNVDGTSLTLVEKKTVEKVHAKQSIEKVKAAQKADVSVPEFQIKTTILQKKFKIKNIDDLSKGPGRSGGGNIFVKNLGDSGKTLDQVEAESKLPITNFSLQWPGFKSYLAYLKKLKKISGDLPDYLLEAFLSKKWSIVNRTMNFATCQNGTFLDVNTNQKLAGVCQFYDEGLVSDQTFKTLKTDEQRIALLIHEGLVNQMLKVLKPLDEKFSSEDVDRVQKNIEIKIHEVTIKLIQEKYTSLEQLVVDLKEARLPLIFSESQKVAMRVPENADKFYFADNYYVGAKEKLQIMSDIFDRSIAFNVGKLSQQFNAEACAVNASGFSVPGYAVGIYLHLDEMIPEVFFTLQSFRGVFEMDIDALKMVRAMGAKMAMAPLQLKEGHWVGSYEISVDMMLEELNKTELDNKNKVELEKQLEFQKALGNSRVVQLEIRQPTDSKIIIKRSVFMKTDKGLVPLFAPDYGMGQLIDCKKKY